MAIILYCSDYRRGLWSWDNSSMIVLSLTIKQRLSPTLATINLFSTTKTTNRQLPLFSIFSLSFLIIHPRRNSFSSSHIAFFKASSGSHTKFFCSANLVCKLSHKKSAHPLPPWPSNMPNILIFTSFYIFIFSSLFKFSFLFSSASSFFIQFLLLLFISFYYKYFPFYNIFNTILTQSSLYFRYIP